MVRVIKFEGVERLAMNLKLHHEKVLLLGGSPDVIVGYTADYAIYVHEMPQPPSARHLQSKRHKRTGQRKFLETPARTMQYDLGITVAKSMKRGLPLVQALLIAGLRLQRASQKIVPIDTGNLRASAFTRKQ